MDITLNALFSAACAVVIGLTTVLSGEQMAEQCPLHAQHVKAPAPAGSEAHAALLERGKHAMGFDQLATSHHFRLTRTGGAIEVHVNGTPDAALTSAVAGHLRTIATQFAQGDFTTSLHVHGETPAGVETLKALAGEITYTFEPGELGGRVRVAGGSAKAIAAIHEFLRYQIREHRTGDPLTVD